MFYQEKITAHNSGQTLEPHEALLVEITENPLDTSVTGLLYFVGGLALHLLEGPTESIAKVMAAPAGFDRAKVIYFCELRGRRT